MKTQITILPTGTTIPDAELEQYIGHLSRQHGRAPDRLTITVDGEYIELNPVYVSPPFERIRRITGYLVGTTNRWNNAKRAEERDRVRHTVGPETEDRNHERTKPNETRRVHGARQRDHQTRG